MQRISIRNTNSHKKVKPRLFDLIKEEENNEWIVEIQGREGKEKVPLSEVLIQITTAMQTQK